MALTLWDESELSQYVQEGYDALTMATGCLWATDVFPDFAYAFTHTNSWEPDYIIAPGILSEAAQFTAEWERDYIDNADGPANHNYHWEQNLGYVSNPLPSGLVNLPEDLYEIERAVWNTLPIDAIRTRSIEMEDMRYELNRGQVEAYLQDKDGLRRLRKWRVPSAPYIPFELDSDTELWGILVQITEIDADTPLPHPEMGDFVQVSGQHFFGDPWGIIVAVYSEPNDMRIEYRRRGQELSARQDFEIPTRYQTYVRHYAQARALEREGEGQDLELAKFYQARYDAGVQRMLRRKQAMQYQRKSIIGGGTRRETGPRLRFPWNYGTVVKG